MKNFSLILFERKKLEFHQRNFNFLQNLMDAHAKSLFTFRENWRKKEEEEKINFQFFIIHPALNFQMSTLLDPRQIDSTLHADENWAECVNFQFIVKTTPRCWNVYVTFDDSRENFSSMLRVFTKRKNY